MSQLPRGWTKTDIAELGDMVGGKTPSKAEPRFWANSTIPWVSPKDMKVFDLAESEDQISESAINEGGMTLLPAQSILMVTRSGILSHTFPVAIAQKPVTINQDIKAVAPAAAFNTRYLAYNLKSQQGTILNDCAKSGTTVASVETERLKKLPIRLAPLPEQKRIADKLDTVLARVDACRDRLDRLPALLKRFRQSILAAATSGRLTEDWRTNQTDRSPGKALKDLEAREQAKENSVKVRGASIAVEPDLLFPLPSPWAWVENHRLAADEQNSICAGPFGTIFKAKDFRTGGVPIIFLRHIGAGRYLTHKPTFMDEDVWKKHHQPYSVRGGELLVTKLGDPPGSACIYPNGSGTAMVTPDVIKMCVDEQVSRPEYLMAYFNSPASKKVVEAACFGVTRLRIDLSLFKTFPIPLPPIEEQTEIVRRVEILFAFADRLEARLSTARNQVNQLTPALLAKAFRGELVPQDPADEPASELLKRLAAAGKDSPPKARRGKVRARA